MGAFTALADLLAYGLLGLGRDAPLGKAVHFFIEDATKIFVLLSAMVFAIAFLRAGVDAGRIRQWLSGRNRLLCYLLAALLGAVTPFCSCSSIPLFLGFAAARIPIGIALCFLIVSPTINEAAVAMLGGILGWRLTAIYVALGLLSGVLGGIFFDAIKAERYLERDLLSTPPEPTSCTCGGARIRPNLAHRLAFAKVETRAILARLWLWILGGIVLGAGLHGYLPDGWISARLGGGEWWSVPLAVGLGIPTYANATTVIPVAGELIRQGLPVGTAFAFMLSTAAASVPEFVMLRKVLSPRLLALFGGWLMVCFTLVGWLLNLLD
ncbi:MAG: permease [Kiritimatiellia bacterium]